MGARPESARSNAVARAFCAALGWALGFFAGSVLRIRRAQVRAAMLHAGIDPKHAEYMYRALGRSLFELLFVAFGLLDAGDVAILDAPTRARIEAARARGPVLFFASHTSNWELVAMRAADFFPLTLVVKKMSVGAVERAIAKIRAKGGVRVVTTDGATKGVRTAIARGDIVATVIDQAPAKAAHGDLGFFLGREASIDRSPAVMAKRARATALVMVAARDDRGRVHVTIADEIAREEIATLSSPAIMRRATARLEAHVLAHPSSWLFLHRRWKKLAAPAPFLEPEKAVIRPSS